METAGARAGAARVNRRERPSVDDPRAREARSPSLRPALRDLTMCLRRRLVPPDATPIRRSDEKRDDRAAVGKDLRPVHPLREWRSDSHSQARGRLVCHGSGAAPSARRGAGAFSTGRLVHKTARLEALDGEWPRLAREANVWELLLMVTRGAIGAVSVDELVEAYNAGCITEVMES